jgi:hypothetical protein
MLRQPKLKLPYPRGVKVRYKLDVKVYDKDKLIKHADCGQVANDYSVLYWLSLIAPFISNASSYSLASAPASAITNASVSLTVVTSATSSVNVLSSPSITVNSYTLNSPTSNSIQITVSGVISSSCGSSCTPTYFAIGGTVGSSNIPVGIVINVNPSSNSCNLSVSQGQTVQFTFTASASATSGNVTDSTFVLAWAEMWAEIVNSLMGSSSPFAGKTYNWSGSGNAVSSYYIQVMDSNGNYIGSYTTSPSSATNISSPQFTMSGYNATNITGASLNLTFNLTSPENGTLNTVKFGFNLNGSANPSGVTYLALLGVLETTVGSINYSIAQGSVYGVSVTENETTTVNS